MISLIAVFLSFAGGFLLANALNRSDLNALKAENERLRNIQDEKLLTESETSSSDEEIRGKITEADQNPTNFDFQKNLGIALYRYATMKKDAEMMLDAARLLTRVYENDKKDYDVIVMLGNIFFDIGYFKKDNAKFVAAREFYQKALEQNPNDADVRTDLGLTYSLATPPEKESAIAEFQKSLKVNPRNEKALEALTEALLSENKTAEAENYLAKLKQVNENNPSVVDLTLQLAQAKNNQQQR